MILGEIIKNYRLVHNLSLQDFADKIGTSRSYIHMLEKNINPSTNKPINPSIETLKALAKAMDMDIDTLLKKLDDNQLIYLNEDKYKEQFTSNAIPIPDTPVKVPIIGKISAGLPILAIENIEGYEFAPSSYIKEGFEYFYLRVSGDSMNLKFRNGDLVLVQKQDELENNEIGVILVNGFDATVKKFRCENGLVVLEPMSTNPEYQVQIYNPKDTAIKIIGKVVSYQGKL